MITPNDVFSKITNNGTRAYCPKCDDKAERIQGTIQINADYAFCHKCLGHWDFLGETDRTAKVEYKLENTTPKVASKEVEKSGYAEAREKFMSTLKENYGISVSRDDENNRFIFSFNLTRFIQRLVALKKGEEKIAAAA